MNSPVLERIKKNDSFLSLFLQGMSLLHSSGIFDCLRERGRPHPLSPESPNYVECQNALFNQAIGYNQALDDLYYFKERFLAEKMSVPNLPMDFGGLDKALADGDLTTEEFDALRGEAWEK